MNPIEELKGFQLQYLFQHRIVVKDNGVPFKAILIAVFLIGPPNYTDIKTILNDLCFLISILKSTNGLASL